MNKRIILILVSIVVIASAVVAVILIKSTKTTSVNPKSGRLASQIGILYNDNGDAGVEIQNMAFQQSDVIIPKGRTVTWINYERTPHTITSDNNEFNIEIGANLVARYTFKKAGVYTYHCNLHPIETGKITVVN